MLKSQVLSIFMVKSNDKNPDKNYHEVWMMIGSIILISTAEFLFKQFNGIGAKVLERLKITNGTANQDLAIHGNKLLEDKSDSCTVTLVRHFEDDSRNINQALNENVEKVDAVIEYLSNLDATKHIILDQRYTIGSDGDIVINDDLSARVKQDPKGAWIEIVLYSDSMRVTEIRQWIDEVHEEYIYEKSNRLGHKTFYFNEIPTEPPRDTTFIREEGADPSEIRWRFDAAPKQLSFTMNEFQTSKSFSNVYGAHVDELRERLNIFVNHPEWYEERGIPHTLGVLLHGIPGAGKTSTIKAIAKDTGRHIFNLALRPYTTCKQLTNLFYDENVNVTTADGTISNYRIPLSKRIYVIEDIDCLTDVVLDRETTHTKKQNHNEVLTLSYLLNLLDGVLETPGRILVITSNYPERIDKALIRPGRIDVKVEFRNADRQFILDMLNHFYECDKSLADIPVSVADKFTPAEVMLTMCAHFKDPDGALNTLIQRSLVQNYIQVSSTSLEDLLAVSDTESNSSSDTPQSDIKDRILVAPVPIPTESKPIVEVTDAVNLTGSDSCPWFDQRIKKVEEPSANRIIKGISDATLFRILGEIEINRYTNEEIISRYGEETYDNLMIIKGQSEECKKLMTHELIEEPDAANAIEGNDLLVDCNAEMAPLHLSEETEKLFAQRFAELAADPETKALKEKIDAKAEAIEAEDTILRNKIINEFTTKAEIKSKRSPLELYFASNVEDTEIQLVDPKTAAKIKAFDLQKEADARSHALDPETMARIAADRKARKDEKQARKARKIEMQTKKSGTN